jgi:Rrf2 family protein
MLNLGLNFGNGTVFLKDIAKAENISEKYLSQIIIPLKNAGFVSATRGAHGGYMLAKDPSNITMKEIFEILEGDLNFVECIKNSSVCKKSTLCTTRKLWTMLDNKLSETLEGVKLSDLINIHNTKTETLTYEI